ncbi:MAG: CHRD domain-containing protein [Phycisphaerales bacterium]|nr:CHRD domain-containing protein [Phycisphaerales bacterium]
MNWSKIIAGVAAVAMSTLALAHNTEFRRVCLLTGTQEVPPNASGADGCGSFVIDPVNNKITYRIVVTNLSSAETAAHIHGPAGPGVNAGVIAALPAGPVKSGVITYPQALEADIIAGRIYVNVHTTNFPGGEVRGQIVTHVASIDGAQEVPANGSNGRGFGLFMYDNVANTLDYYIAYAGLSAAETAAHIHGFARIGVNAGIKHTLPAGNLKVGTWNFTDADEESLWNGMTYVNIHSTNIPGGEIRGQIVSTVVPIDATQEVPANGSPGVGCGFVSLDLTGNNLSYDIRYANLTAAETAAHIHGFGGVGQNAGVKHTLAAGARKIGNWAYGAVQSDENMIRGGLAYINVHTANFPGGEIRGQIQPPFLPYCPGDFNDDGFVNALDYDEFADLFESGGTGADVNFDGFVNALDYDEFAEHFETGC